VRLRIIAYGVGVLAILTVVSIVSFALVKRNDVTPDIHLLAASIARADSVSRERLLEDALAGPRLEISVYAPDQTLLGTNVRPPLPPSPRLRPGGVVPSPSAGANPEYLAHRPPWLSWDGLRPPKELHDIDGVEVMIRPPPPSAKGRFIIPLVVSLVCLVLLSFPVTAAMTRQLRALAQTARRFGEGDLGQRADASGSNEVSRTAQAFNSMAQRIAELRLRERELLANVSHELRTPMSRMAVVLELTQDNPAAASRYVGELARDLRELESLLDSIIETLRLDLASPRARASWPLQREPLDLRDLVSEVATDFRARTPEHPLAVDLGTVAVVRQVDRTLVRRALMNLLDNARKYSPADTEIRLVIEDGGTITVNDGGGGIDPADLPHVFEPFFRADRSRSRATGGVGLGLTFVRTVAALHQGQVSVHSQPGAGSTFRLSLG
jgi:signal transduction histidine kinase